MYLLRFAACFSDSTRASSRSASFRVVSLFDDTDRPTGFIAASFIPAYEADQTAS